MLVSYDPSNFDGNEKHCRQIFVIKYDKLGLFSIKGFIFNKNAYMHHCPKNKLA